MTASQRDFPMTEIEKKLKSIFGANPDIGKKILTHTELSQYIAWLIRTYGQESSEPTPPMTYSTPLSELTTRMLADPQDERVFGSLATAFGTQREDSYLLADHDISISRMFRYMPAHWHINDYFEIYYCFSGSCPIHFSGETVHMKPGTVLIVAPSVLHASPCYRDDSVLFYYMLRSSTFDRVFWNQLPPENLMTSFFRRALEEEKHASYLHFETGVDRDIERLLSRIYDEFTQAEAYTAQMLNALMSTFFVLLLRRYGGSARLPRTDDFYWKHEFSAILTYIQNHYQEKTLSQIAAHFHYSERQISRIVLNCTGSNYAQLVLKLRMEKAANLLKQNNAPVEVIASATGYSTLSSFYRAFTRYYHCTPVEFQKDPAKRSQSVK